MQTASMQSGLEDVVAEAMARVERGELELPVLPDVVFRILSLSLDQNDSAGDLARILSSDSTLVTEILRVANSPAFAGVVEIESLSQAIMRLGFMGLRQIAVTTCLKSTAFRSDHFGEALAGLWRDALARGFWSREIALLVRDNPDSAYLAGLLKDIGRPIALIALERLERPELAGQADVVEHLASRLGGYIAENWALPEYVRATIAGDRARFPQLLGIVGLADALTHMAEAPVPETVAVAAAEVGVPIYTAEAEQLCASVPRLAEVLASQ